MRRMGIMDKEHLQQFRELLIKADSTSIKFMRIAIEQEERKRNEIRMAQDFGYYGNERMGYRMPDGSKLKELPQPSKPKNYPPMPPLARFDKSVYQ